MRISVETLHAGWTAKIEWTAIPDISGYSLERKLDSETVFSPVYTGTGNTFTDRIPETARTVTYRVSWHIDAFDLTWDEIDALDLTWDELDALDWQWTSFESEYTVTEPLQVTPNRPPVISGADGDLGAKYKGFDVVFSVTDPDPGNTVNITVKLDGAVIFDRPNAQQGTNYTVTITDAQIFAMAEESRHSVTITATDNKGAYAIRTHTFTAVEDLVTTAVFYVLRDGRPVAKLSDAQQWTDYMEVGTHRYVIRGVDKYGNFTDSNEVTVTISVENSTLARVSTPDEYMTFIARMDERPQIRHNHSPFYSETWYEGREYPIYESSGRRSNSQSIAFSTLTLRERQNLFSMILMPGPFIFRDCYNNRIVGVIPDLSNDFQGRFPQQAYDAIIDFNLAINQCDYNEVITYD